MGAFLIKLIEDKATGVFNALGPDKLLTIGQMLAACKRAAQSNATFTWADAEFLTKEGIHAWSDMPVWVPSSGETAGFAKVSNARALKAGLTFLPIEETAKATLDWFSTQPAARRAKLRAGITADREAKVLAAWKARPEKP